MPIHILAPEHAQKIAAGEVVERPSNIIKELLENALDAGSTRIELAVVEGGKKSIVITDNGCGMNERDVRLCFERHATSKLVQFDDLLHIKTFGFRGEALASVCGVARVTLTTKEHGAVEGIRLSVEEGKILSQSSIGSAAGTTIQVDDLFYNIPVRKKFLKSTATEWNQISSLFKAFCLTYPDIHFTLVHDGATVLNCPPVVTLTERVDQLFDYALSSSLLVLDPMEERGMKIEGGITNPHYSRYDRSGFYFFVNNRFVKNFSLSKAVMKGIGHILPGDKYPCAIIKLTLDPNLVDINIHPKKEEVLFLHPQLVENLITTSISKTLERHLSTRLQQASQSLPTGFKEPFLERGLQAPISSQPTFWPKNTAYLSPRDQLEPVSFGAKPIFFEQQQSATVTVQAEEQPAQLFEQQAITSEEQSYRIVGQINATYILLDHPDGMLIVDQHAAHERILYERFKNRFTGIETVPLLFPPIISLTEPEVDTLMVVARLLQELGISIERASATSCKVTATPVYAKQLSYKELCEQLLCWVQEAGTLSEHDLFKQVTEKLRAQLACKAAVKAGDSLSHEQMQQLIRDLATCESRFSCPHGRPTQWLLTTYELEKKFKRVGQ